LQCEIRLTRCIFINRKDFSSFLCQLQHMHGGVLTQSKSYCNVFRDSPVLQLIHLYISTKSKASSEETKKKQRNLIP